ncbi:SoxR reducing system RseC family protein [Acidobacteriota bacterium]
MDHHSEIRHKGKVVEIEKGKFFVKITSRSACQGCRVRTVCSAADMAEKIIETFSDRDLHIGDEVTVIMEERLGLTAVFYSFFLPFLVMGLVLFVCLTTGISEMLAALCAIASLIPYYLLLHLFGKHFEKDFIFRAEPLSAE